MQRKYDPVNLVRGVVRVASLPSIYLKIEKALHDERTSSKDISDIVSDDTALAGRVLRLANSAMYHFPSKISTISQAVTVIGTRQLRDLVLACSIISVFKDMPSNLVNMESFWRHSIGCALTARVLSKLRHENNVESAFVSGLLHDIGQLILFKDLGEEMRQCIELANRTNKPLDEVERNIFGFDHALLGGLLLKEWKLPPLLVETTQHHHSPSRSTTFPVEAAYVHIANFITTMMNLGSNGARTIPKLDHVSWERLDFSADIIDRVTDEVREQYTCAVEFVLGEAA